MVKRWGRAAVLAGLVICLIVAARDRAGASAIQAPTSKLSVGLGAAYDSKAEEFKGGECLKGIVVLQGAHHSTFDFGSELSQRQAESLLGLEMNGRARFGAVEASASAQFLQRSVSNDFSVSAVWASEYILPDRRLSSPILTNVGKQALEKARWAETCGDEYVTQVRQGARLLFSIRIDFASKEQKQEFQSKFSVSGPLASVSGSLAEATKQFSRDTKITIAGAQFGGDVSKLTGVFPSATPDGKNALVKCTLGDFEQCAEVVASALKYAANTDTGFPSQLAPGRNPGPGHLEYRTAPYSAAGIYPKGLLLVAWVKEKREYLHACFEEQFRWLILGRRLQDIVLNSTQKEKLAKQITVIDRNIDKIVAASDICYDAPANCRAAVNAAVLTKFDKSAFNLPPAVRASFRIFTSEKGLLSRAQSVSLMTACHSIDNVCIRPKQLEEVAGQGTASVVLYLEGIAMRDATLYFEDRALGAPFPLQAGTAQSAKLGKGWAMLVIESTRKTPGWRDIALENWRKELWNGDLKVADGMFYVVVQDAFGRRPRFELDYENWNQTVSPPLLRISNRWWSKDSGGVSAGGSDDWTFETVERTRTWVRGPHIRSIAVRGCGGGGGGGGAGGARHELVDNGGGGGGGAGAPPEWKVIRDLKASAYRIELGIGGAGGSGGPGGGASGNGLAGMVGTVTRFGPSVDIDPATGQPVDPRVWEWAGAPGGAGGKGSEGFNMAPVRIYVPQRDGAGGSGGNGAGFVAGGNGGNPESAGSAGADWDPSGGASGGAGGSLQSKDGWDGGGGGGGGAAVGAGGKGGNGGGNVADAGSAGGWCAGGGGGGAYGENNSAGNAGGRGGDGSLMIFKLDL